MNKFGGINDLPSCDKRIYNLWFQMLRRCYDTTQHERNRGKSYANCEVCERWKVLSCFAKDIKKLDGYGEWETKTGYCLDKDIKNPGNKVYSKENCCFVPYTENIREISKRKPGNIQKLHEAKKVCYMLQRDGETMLFNSEKDACEYLGVVKCSVSSCFRKGSRCKGWRVTRIGNAKMESDGE